MCSLLIIRPCDLLMMMLFVQPPCQTIVQCMKFNWGQRHVTEYVPYRFSYVRTYQIGIPLGLNMHDNT